MNNVTISILLCVAALAGVIAGALWVRLRNPNKHDDVFNLTEEQRIQRDGDLIRGGINFVNTLQREKQMAAEYPASSADAFSPLSDYAKTMYPPERQTQSSTNSYSDLKDPDYEKKMEEQQRLRTEKFQKEMAEKQEEHRIKEQQRLAAEQEERVLRAESEKIKADLKRWLY